MSLVKNTLSAWLLMETLQAGVVKDLNVYNSDTVFNKKHKKVQAFNTMNNLLQNNDFKLKNNKSGNVKFSFYRYCFHYYQIHDFLNNLKKDNYEIYNKPMNLCYGYTYEVTDEGKLVIDSLHVPLLMYILKHLPKTIHLEIKDKFQDLFSKFVEDIKVIVADDVLSDDKINLMDAAYNKYFHSFDYVQGTYNHQFSIQFFSKDDNNNKTNFNSFYIEDIEKAREQPNETLEKYILGVSSKNKTIIDENQTHIEEMLHPNKLPDGRWPTYVEHNLSLMQQVAVNTIINSKSQINSVNGPPGTGKTTLLKDIFAHNTVERAKVLTQFDKPEKAFKRIKLNDFDQYRTPIVDKKLTEHKMVVTSSNNGAVENISKDLPKIDELFREKPGKFPKYETDMQTSAKPLLDFSEIGDQLIKDKSWGIFSGVFGKGDNIKEVIQILLFGNSENESFISLLKKLNDEYDENSWQNAIDNFNKTLSKIHSIKKELASAYSIHESSKKDLQSITQFKKELAEKSTQFDLLNSQKIQLKEVINKLTSVIQNYDQDIQQYDTLIKSKKDNRSFINKLFAKENTDIIELQKKQEKLITDRLLQNEILRNKQLEQTELENQIDNLTNDKNKIERQITNLSRQTDTLTKLKEKYTGLIIPDANFWSKGNYSNRQLSNLWSPNELQFLRGKLFIEAMHLHQLLLIRNATAVQNILFDFKDRHKYVDSAPRKVENAWNLIHLIFPVISTTFASFNSMYKTMPENFIDYLFVDEAGQAVPQAAVGALYRSKRAIVVGDPIQIEPVITIDDLLIELIRKTYELPEYLLSKEASVQSLSDNANQFGYYKGDGEDKLWIGIPLWVHRRCLNPMFSIANEIAYENKMVLPAKMNKPGTVGWYDSVGNSSKLQFVKEHVECLVPIIIKHWKNREQGKKPNVYIISPFTAVVRNTKEMLKRALLNDLNEDKKLIIDWINSSIGTVHTFQGKEADFVYFIIGTDENQNGAVSWSCSKPNLLNVAVTRAKKEFYIIGDYDRISKFQYYDIIKNHINTTV